MGVIYGVNPTWAAQTDAGRTHIATKGVVQSGLVLNLDAGVSSSYSGSGTTWTDLSGNGNNGTLTNGPTYSSSNGGSIVFDGGDDYVTLGTPSILNGVQVPLTIIGWANASDISGNRTLYGVYQSVFGGEIYSMIRLDNGTLKYYASTSNLFYQFQGTFVPSLNTWNFYAVTVSGTLSSPTVTIYLNNSSETFSYSAFTSSPYLSVDFRIGANSSGYPEYWSGNIAQVSIYNRALTAAEIQQNFNATRSRYGI